MSSLHPTVHCLRTCAGCETSGPRLLQPVRKALESAMRRPDLVLALSASAVARRSVSEQPWAPPQETNAVELHQAQIAMGWSPRPTEAPGALLGRMLMPRIDDFTLGPKTCGFQSTDGGESVRVG